MPRAEPTGRDTLGMLEGGEVKGLDFSEQSIRKGFIRKVYGILMCQLLVTVSSIVLFLYCEPAKAWLKDTSGMITMAIMFVAMVVCLIVMLCCESARRKSPMNFIFLGMFTIGISFHLSFASSMLKSETVLIAVGMTAAICLALTLFAFQTKWDFTAMGAILLCALVILLLFSILGINAAVTHSRVLPALYASLGALLFSFYLVYDTQLMMGGEHKYSISPEEYIFAALNLYLDIVNLFIYILKMTR